MKKLGKFTTLLVVSMFCMAAHSAFAQNDYSLTHSSGDRTLVLAVTDGHQFSVDGEGSYDRLGDIKVSGGTLNIVFNTSDYIYLAKSFQVTQGTLHLSLGTGYTTGHATLTRASGFTSEFFFVNNSSLVASDCVLRIEGTSSDDFVMDGGCRGFKIVNNAPTYNDTTSVLAEAALLISTGGMVDFDHVVMKNNYNVCGSSGTGNHNYDGGAMNFRSKSDNNTAESGHVITMDYCRIDSCYARGSGGAFRVRVNNKAPVPLSSMVMNNCVVNYCYSDGGWGSQGGVIRTWGASRCGLTMNNCTVENNYNYDGYSTEYGMMHWNAFEADTLRLVNCVFDSNWNKGEGGAINVVSKAKFEGCQITNNRSERNGGGMCYTTYTSNKVISGLVVGDSNLTLDDATIIENNSAALNGGGLWIQVNIIENGPGHEVYLNPYGDTISVNLHVDGASIRYNTAQNGGGVYMERTTSRYHTDINLNSGRVALNSATQNGGGLYASGGVAVNVGMSGAMAESMDIVNNTAVNGGGLYLANGNIRIYGGNIGLEGQPNVCQNGDGGGIYVFSGHLTMNGGLVSYNQAVHGGGIHLSGGQVVYNSGFVRSNQASTHGGGIYISGGSFSMSGGAIGGTQLQGNKTSSNSSFGGGLYMSGGTAFISGGAIAGNKATNGYGGGIYMQGGTCTLSNDASIGGDTTTYTNNALYGGGIYSSGGTISIEGGLIAYNTATRGGGIYSNGPTAEVYVRENSLGGNPSRIEYNSAQNGGGIYAEKGIVEFSDGVVRLNFASVMGGGMYIANEGSLLLKGTSLLQRNHVPTGGQGGGVYLLGTLTVGEEGSATGSSIQAQDNFASDTDTPDTFVIDKTTRNNVQLPNPDAMPYTSTIHREVITVIENGIDITSKVGFTVPRSAVPVIFCQRSSTSWEYLDRFTTGPDNDLQNVLFDDMERYISVHFDARFTAFDPDHVYLYAFWPEAVPAQPEGFSFDNIDSEEDLAWLITWVNGRTGMEGYDNLEPHDCEGQTINLNADLDMSEYGWAPIGQTNPDGNIRFPFKGTFEGNGHTITGLIGMDYKQHYGYGFFGNVNGGVVRNVILDGVTLLVRNVSGYVVGPLVAEMQGEAVLSNCEASAVITAKGDSPIIGGAVGRMGNYGTESPMVHSVCAMAEMRGGVMGGLVGKMVKGSLYNSFANPLYDYIGSNHYYGGLVGINAGNVANCYVRLRGSLTPSNYFGKLVGQHNASGDLQYCYAPSGFDSLNYYGNKVDGSVFTNYRYYDNNAETPYMYLRRDVQVHVVDGDNEYIPAEPTPDPYSDVDEDKQMLLCLNNWVVKKNSTTPIIYTMWLRPGTTVINGDYPILRMPATDAVACTGDAVGGENEVFLHYAQVNDLIAAYPLTADTAVICLYQSNGNVDSNVDSGAKLYIDEKVSVIQNGPLNAYVGVTLDNSADSLGANPTYGGTDNTDWHMFSTPLANAPLAVKYVHNDGTADSTQYMFSYEHSQSASGDPMPYYQFYNETERDGYFPSHVYGKSYIENDNMTPVGSNNENYYSEWDYYTYYEPEYHWVNFKRNSKSHWHEDMTWEGISYQNEEYLIKGRGYLLATRHPTYLQCYGTLNGSEAELTIPVTYNDNFQAGYNLLGNPYLAYLDFDLFADLNGTSLWQQCDTTGWCYCVLDEDPYYDIAEDTTYLGGYKYYAYHSSVNPYGAPKYIAPHQGFMIKLPCEANDVVYFTPDMRSLNGDGGHFRSAEQPAYPLVNLFATDATGNRDMTTVELGRTDQGGALMMRDLKLATCHVWCHYEDRDWAIAFTKPGLTEVPIRFEAYENGEYTLTWNTQNGMFSYLHLVDNMTGVDVDCLSEKEYRFMATTTDYRSRFRLLFGYTGVEEDETNGDQQVADFAFQSGDELVVNGEGMLRMFDMTGRQVMSGEMHGTQTSTPLPDISVGVYLLQLNTVNGTRIQKIVIK